jgi:hypothetical protein
MRPVGVVVVDVDASDTLKLPPIIKVSSKPGRLKEWGGLGAAWARGSQFLIVTRVPIGVLVSRARVIAVSVSCPADPALATRSSWRRGAVAQVLALACRSAAKLPADGPGRAKRPAWFVHKPNDLCNASMSTSPRREMRSYWGRKSVSPWPSHHLVAGRRRGRHHFGATSYSDIRKWQPSFRFLSELTPSAPTFLKRQLGSSEVSRVLQR